VSEFDVRYVQLDYNKLTTLTSLHCEVDLHFLCSKSQWWLDQMETIYPNLPTTIIWSNFRLSYSHKHFTSPPKKTLFTCKQFVIVRAKN
jgi:hypothetical protein